MPEDCEVIREAEMGRAKGIKDYPNGMHNVSKR
jgi:hypothetical protein